LMHVCCEFEEYNAYVGGMEHLCVVMHGFVMHGKLVICSHLECLLVLIDRKRHHVSLSLLEYMLHLGLVWVSGQNMSFM
jgi:hypothetical protein